MTSNSLFKQRRISPGGFTLVEIILVIAIGVVFFGGAALVLTSSAGDRDLVEARKQMQQVARDARMTALSQGSKQTVILNANGAGVANFSGGVEMDIVTPRDLASGLKGWGRPLDYQWSFTGGGLVEPIRVRLRKGGNAEQFSFSALTGEIVPEAPDEL